MSDTTPSQDVSPAVRYGCVGCLTFVAGIFSGGMIGVFIAKVVGSFRNCKPLPDLPACDWHVYAGLGMLIGAVTLPLFSLIRLRKGEKEADKSG